jgi:hypothetical protein
MTMPLAKGDCLLIRESHAPPEKAPPQNCDCEIGALSEALMQEARSIRPGLRICAADADQ